MWTEFIINVLEDGALAAIAAIGFSSISHTPRRAYITIGGIAAVGHAVRYILTHDILCNNNIIIASTIAALCIGILSVIFSGRIKCPAEVCFFPALLPMIPGMYAYRTIEALLLAMHHSEEALFQHYLYLLEYNGLTCVFIIIGMVLGATLPVFALKRLAFQATR